MKRRIGNIGLYTGLGNNTSIMDGQKTDNENLNKLIKKVAKDVYLKFFKGTKLDENYCDAQYREYEITFGVEPSYMYEELKILVFCKRKDLSYIETGYAWGGWGTGIRSKRKYYQEYKKNSKFKKIIDKWHDKLFANSEGGLI